MQEKLILTFNTEYDKKFNMSINDPKEGLTRLEIEREATKIIASNVLRPAAGMPVSLDSAKIVKTDTTVLV